MLTKDAPGIPPPPRTHAEPPRRFALEAPHKSGDPDNFHFNHPSVVSPHPDGFATDVPRSVTFHSPGGFAWGYRGSGAQDLALNMLNYVFPPGSDGHEPVRAGDGFVSWRAERLHGAYTEEVVATIPREEPFRISRHEVTEWVERRSRDLSVEPLLPAPLNMLSKFHCSLGSTRGAYPPALARKRDKQRVRASITIHPSGTVSEDLAV